MTKQKRSAWRYVVPIFAVLFFATGLYVLVNAADGMNNWSWTNRVGVHIRSAGYADESWMMRQKLCEANTILTSHDWNQTLDYYIVWTIEAEEIEDEREYKRELYYIKQNLDYIDLSFPDMTPLFLDAVAGVIMIFGAMLVFCKGVIHG